MYFVNDLKLYKSLILAKKYNYMTFYFHCTWHLHTCIIMTGANIHCNTFKNLHKYMKHTGIYSAVYLFHSFQIKQTSDLFNRQIRKSFQSKKKYVLALIYIFIPSDKKNTKKRETWSMISKCFCITENYVIVKGFLGLNCIILQKNMPYKGIL